MNIEKTRPEGLLDNLENLTEGLDDIILGDVTLDSHFAYEIENKPSVQLEREIGRMKNEIDSSSSYIRDKVAEIGKRTGDLENAYPANIKDLESLISDSAPEIRNILRLLGRMNSLKVLSGKACENYDSKRLEEAGFSSMKEVREKKKKLRKEIYCMMGKFSGLGKYIYRKKAGEKNEELDRLYELSDKTYFSTPSLHQEKEGIKKATRRIFNLASKAILEEYENLLKHTEKGKEGYDLTEETIKTLDNDFLRKYVIPQIKNEKTIRKGADNYVSREYLYQIRERGTVKETLSLVREVFNSMANFSMNLPEEEDLEKAKEIQKRKGDLPQPMQEIVEQYSSDEKNAFIRSYKMLADLTDRFREDPEWGKAFSSYKSSLEKLSSMMESSDLIHKELDLYFEIKERLKYLEESLDEAEGIADSLDVRKWNVFKENQMVRNLFGEEAIEKTGRYLSDLVLDGLLQNREGTEKSVRLGYKLFEFKNADSIPFVILNSYREPGFSGVRPFLSKNAGTGNSKLCSFISSLKKSDMAYPELDEIPGLKKIIYLIRGNPNNFSSPEVEERGIYVTNPVERKIMTEVANMCLHYLRNGSKKEKYFVTSMALRLISPYGTAGKKRLMDGIVQMSGLGDDHLKKFNSYAGFYTSRLRLATREYGERIEEDVKKTLENMKKYLDKAESLIGSSGRKGILRREFKAINEDYLNHAEDFFETSEKALEYLGVFDSEKVQGYLSRKNKLREVYARRMMELKRAVFDREKNVKAHEVRDVVTYSLGRLEDIAVRIGNVTKNSKYKGILEREEKRVLERLAASSPLEIESGDHLGQYFRALDDEDSASKLKIYTQEKRSMLEHLAKLSYSMDKSATIPFVRKVLEKEKDQRRLSLLFHGLYHISEKWPEKYFLKLFESEPNSAYGLLTDVSMIRPLIDKRFEENVNGLLRKGAAYEIDERYEKILIKHGIESDSDIGRYLHLAGLQGKEPKEKSVAKLAKAKSQMARFLEELEKNGRNEALAEKVKERKERIASAISREETSCIYGLMKSLYEKAIEDITDKPVSYENLNEDMINAILTYRQIHQNRTLLKEIITDYTEGTPFKFYSKGANKDFIRDMKAAGLNMKSWSRGIRRTYSPEIIEDVMGEKNRKVKEHELEALNIYQSLGYDIKKEDIFDKYDDLVNKGDADQDVLLDLKTQLGAIEELENATYNSNLSDIEIYMETDPLKILQMGNVVSGSCLGLGRGNTWSTVANAADANKKVLYASMNGEIIGRKLIAINDERKIVQFRTYNNRLDVDMDKLFGNYLSDLSKEVKAPLGYGGSVPNLVSQAWYNDGTVSK